MYGNTAGVYKSRSFPESFIGVRITDTGNNKY